MPTMTPLAFGITMSVVGMGGTLLTLWLLTLLIRGLTALLPVREEPPAPVNREEPRRG